MTAFRSGFVGCDQQKSSCSENGQLLAVATGCWALNNLGNPSIAWPRSEHRLQSASVMAIAGQEPGFFQALRNDHRHAVVQRLQQGIGFRGDHAAGFDFAAIGTDPSVPEAC